MGHQNLESTRRLRARTISKKGTRMKPVHGKQINRAASYQNVAVE